MESVLWNVETLGGFLLYSPFLVVLIFALLVCWDYPLLVGYYLFHRAVLGRSPGRRDPCARALPVLLAIPTLLRKRDELASLLSTIRSIIDNRYPGRLTVVVSIDGTTDAPELWAQLQAWAAQQATGDFFNLFVTGTPQRRGKPMAIDHAIGLVKGLVAAGALPEFPPVYVSTDADADLGPGALEALVYRLQKRHWLTRAPARIVAGALHVRGNQFWRGWRTFFSPAGQLNLQVAREYYVSNVGRHNVRALPATGVPGALYGMWSEIFLAIPSFFGYLRTRHWLKWWLGISAPKFADCQAPTIPELMAGDTDDTVSAYTATLARYDNGHFTLELPRTPLHAFYYMLRTLLVDRPLHYEPAARVYTSSPTTCKALFKQRKRWNSSRVELTLRFRRVLGYHWSLGLPAMIIQALMARSVLVGLFAYFVVPAFLWKDKLLTVVVLLYAFQVVQHGLLTSMALLMSGELGLWKLGLGLPLAPLYMFIFNWVPGAVGTICDVLLFGNVTGFAPESTLKRGGSVRIALAFRLRRFLKLAFRSAVRGDVPLGRFWFGWGETPWTPSGFDGWTSRRKSRPAARS